MDADISTVYRILDKWSSFTERWEGMFVRYLDGNPANGKAHNVACVSPREALARIGDPEWTVNWPQPLLPDEVQFVLDNREKFAAVFGGA